jgi:hypothetical protein
MPLAQRVNLGTGAEKREIATGGESEGCGKKENTG